MMEITKLIEEYGIVVGLSISGFLALRSKLKEVAIKIIDVLLSNLGKSSIEKRIISHHQFYTFMNECINYRIDSVRFESKAKTIIFKKFLKLKFNTFLVNFSEFNKKEYLSKDPSELRTDIMNMFSISIKQYNDEFKSVIIDELKGDERLYELIVSKFDEWHEDTIRDTKEEIEEVFHERKDNKNVIWECLTALKFGFRRTMSDGVRSFNELNGELEKITI